jgi:hypothetical protein
MFMAYCRRSQCCPQTASLIPICGGSSTHLTGDADGNCRQYAATQMPFPVRSRPLSRSYAHAQAGRTRLPGPWSAEASSTPGGRRPNSGRTAVSYARPCAAVRRAPLPVGRYQRTSALRLLAAPPRGEMRIQGPPQREVGQFTGRCRLCTARLFARLCWVLP